MLGSLLLHSGRRRSFPLPDFAELISPRNLAGLVYWFDAQDLSSLYQDSAFTTRVTADGQAVGAWKDKQNGNDVTQATGSLRPLYRASYINGRPAVEADGVDDYLRAIGLSLTQPMTVYCVSKAATNANMTWFDGSGASTERVRILSASTGQFSINAGSGINDGSVDAAAHLHTAVFNTTASEYYLDSVLVGGPATAGAQNLVGLTLFANRTNGNVLAGGIGEFLIYSGAHSAAQRRLVELYLKQRWGL